MRLLPPLPLLLLGLLSVTGSCGAPEAALDDKNSQLAMDGTATVTNDDSATFSLDSTGVTSILPGNIPSTGQETAEFKVRFRVKISISTGGTFTYNEKKWSLAFTTPTGTKKKIYANKDITLVTTGDLNNGFERSADLEMTIAFADKIFPAEILAKKATVAGRDQIYIRPFYAATTDDAPSFDSGKPIGPIIWQSDIGAIKNPASIDPVSATDSAINIRWSGPNPATAQQWKTNALADAGTSTIVSYLIVYWSDDACKAAGTWDFRPNRSLTSNDAASQQCTYQAVDSQNVCDLGCSNSDLSGFSGLSLNAIAEPANAPDVSSLGIGEQVTVGCYHVIRVAAATTSFTVTGLENGVKYGAMVYPVDSSGHTGMTRSACRFATAIQTPLMSDSKTSGIKRTKEDCFVVTAASGDANSLAVHYWRILRDRYLTRIGFSAWYYRHGPSMADWVREHPAVKAPLHFLLRNTGKFLIKADELWRGTLESSAQVSKKVLDFVQGFLWETASAQEAPINQDPRTEPASGHFQVMGGPIFHMADKALWDTFYGSRNMGRIIGVQSFGLLHFGPIEWNAGLSLSYMWADGRVPNKLYDGSIPNPNTIGRPVNINAIGAGLESDLRFRNLIGYWLSPRLSLTAGAERMREEANVEKPAASGTTTDSSKKTGKPGYTFVKPFVSLRGGLEFSLYTLLTEEVSEAQRGYNLNDLCITLYGEFYQDLSNKGPSLSHLGVGAGIAYIFQ